MRIALPENNKGLNDNGELSHIKTIEKEVQKFRDRLREDSRYSTDRDYQKMIEQLDEYWQKLFSNPIVAKTKAGTILIQPQRTNNILEQLFRNIARGYRRKSGLNCMEKTIKAMLADTPLVKNLENKEYLVILLDGKNSLEELFAEIDAKEVREQVMKSENGSNMVPPRIKKLLKITELPESIVSLFNQRYHDMLQDPSADLMHKNYKKKIRI